MRPAGRFRRRIASVPAVFAVAVLSLVGLPFICLALVLADLVRLRFRLPLLRLFLFGICWAWLEVCGVIAAGALWCLGRAGDVAAHYRLQAWWADRLMTALRITCGLEVRSEGVEFLAPGPTVLLVRHASLADSLLTAWTVTARAGMRPRVVMKRELLVDPCLDIVGNRLPNCFVDRGAKDSGPELASIASMAEGLGRGDVAVLFPEGTRVNPAKKERAVRSIERSDPERARRVAGLQHLLPARPGGAEALLGSACDAEICVGSHVGFEGLDTFGGIISALGRRPDPVHIRFRRIERPDSGLLGRPDFTDWLDTVWESVDEDVQSLSASGFQR